MSTFVDADMNVAKRQEEAFLNNERVQFLLRRMTERANTDFRKMLNLTVSQHGSNWQTYWQHTLPKIRTWSTIAINAITEEFEREVRNAKILTEFAYLRYVCLGYGKDAYGRKNKLEVELITFGMLYHAFMVRLAKTRQMIDGTWFSKPEEMERISANALSDALHDLSEMRVHILPSGDVPVETPSTPTYKDFPEISKVSQVQSYVSKASSKAVPLEVDAMSTVTPTDSASQVNSLGIRHQKMSQIPEPEQQHKPTVAQPRIIAFGGNLVKPPPLKAEVIAEEEDDEETPEYKTVTTMS